MFRFSNGREAILFLSLLLYQFVLTPRPNGLCHYIPYCAMHLLNWVHMPFHTGNLRPLRVVRFKSSDLIH